MDGYIKIGTKIDDSGFDKDISNIEKKIEIAEQEKIVISTKMQSTQESLNKVQNELSVLQNQADNLKNTFGNTTLNTANFEQFTAIKEYQNLMPEIEKLRQKQSKITEEINKQSIRYDKINNKVSQYKAKIEKINLSRQEKQLQKIEKSVGNTISKIAKWAGALVGIRSTYALIRNMANSVAQYNSQISTDMQYMGFAIAKVFEPLIEFIINGLYKILSLINQIAIVFFGVNLFKNSGVDQFKKAIGSAEKSSEKLKNNLASFDDLDILSDDEKSGQGGGIETPSVDLSKLEAEPPLWMTWIKENLPELIGLVLGLVGAVIALKNGFSLIEALGIGVLIYGIVQLISDFLDYLKDPTWENFGEIVTDIGLILVGVGLIIGSIPLIVAGAIATIVGLVISNWDFIQSIFTKAKTFINNILTTITNWFLNNMDTIKRNFGDLGVGIMAIVVAVAHYIGNIVIGLITMIQDLLNGLFTGVKQILDGIILILSGKFKQGIILVMKGIANIIIGVINAVVDGINAILYPIRTLIASAGRITGNNWTIEDISIPRLPLLAQGGIVSRPTQAIIGEAGREAVVPLENNTEWMDVLADRISQSISGFQISAQGNGQWNQFMKFLNIQLTKEQKRTGSSIIGGMNR